MDFNAMLNIDKSEWKKYKFSDIAKSISERVDPKATHLETYVGLEHLDPESIHIKRFGKKTDVKGEKLKVYPGDVIFGKRRAYQRKAAISNLEGFCSAHAFVLRANPDVICQELFPFFLHSDTFMNRAVKISVGSLSPTINWGTLKGEEFLLPPKDQQEKIAELLWAADEVRETYFTLKNDLKILFNIFIRFLREGETGWKKSRLNGLISLNYGVGLNETDRVSGKYDVVGSSGICDKHNKFLVKGPGIVVGRKGSAGEVVWIENDFWPIDTTFWVEPHMGDLDLKFLYYLLISSNLRKHSISTAVPGINRDDALLTTVLYPQYNEQLKIREKFDSVAQAIASIDEELFFTNQLLKNILNKIF